jgi:hypothetical protein
VSEILDAARERLARNALGGWSKDDLVELEGLPRRFADNLTAPEQVSLGGQRE